MHLLCFSIFVQSFEFALEMQCITHCTKTTELFFGRVFTVPSRGEGERAPIPESKLWELMTNKTWNSSLYGNRVRLHYIFGLYYGVGALQVLLVDAPHSPYP